MIYFTLKLYRGLADAARFMVEVIDDVRANRRAVERQYGQFIGE